MLSSGFIAPLFPVVLRALADDSLENLEVVVLPRARVDGLLEHPARNAVGVVHPLFVVRAVHGPQRKRVHALPREEVVAVRQRHANAKLRLHVEHLAVRRSELRHVVLLRIAVFDRHEIAVRVGEHARLLRSERRAADEEHEERRDKRKRERRKLLRDEPADDLRVGLALRELHDLPDEKARSRLLAVLVILHWPRIRGNRLVDERLERRSVAHGAKPAFLDDLLGVAALLEDLGEKFLQGRAVDRPGDRELHERGERGRRHRALADRLPARVHESHHVAHEEIAKRLRRLLVEPLRGGFVPVGVLLVLRKDLGVVFRDAVFLDHASAPRLGLLGEEFAPFLYRRLVKFDGHEVGLGEVAVVVRVFLGAHRGSLHRLGVPPARLLHDRNRVGHALPLAPRLVDERGVYAAEGVHVLYLDLRAELLLADGPDRDVDVGAHVALFEVAVADARVDEHLLKRGQIGDRVVGRLHVGLGDDLHQGRSAAVEVDARGRGVVVDLRRVLLEVDVVDPDELLRAVGARDLHAAADAEGTAVLGDLVVLRHVGVEVVLAVEGRMAVHLAAEHEPRHDCELHRLLVHHGKRPRIAEAHRAHVRVGLAAGLQQTAAEHLRPRLELDMRLKSYRVLEFHRKLPGCSL